MRLQEMRSGSLRWKGKVDQFKIRPKKKKKEAKQWNWLLPWGLDSQDQLHRLGFLGMRGKGGHNGFC